MGEVSHQNGGSSASGDTNGGRAGHRPPRELPTAGGGALAEFSLTCAWRRRRGSPRSWDSSRDATRTWRRQRSLPRNMVTPTHQRETYSQSLSAEFLMESSPPSSVVQTFGVLGNSGNDRTSASRALPYNDGASDGRHQSCTMTVPAAAIVTAPRAAIVTTLEKVSAQKAG